MGDNGELWTADTEHPSLTEPKVTLAFTDHSFARGPERTCSARSPACLFTTLSSKLKESEASPEVKGSREENVVNVNLEDSTMGLSAHSNPRAMGRSQNHNTQELGGLFEKFSGESSAKTELCLRHCRAETPSIHPSYHVACLFYRRDATGQ